MAFSSRILGLLERELSKQLTFSFCDLSVADARRLTLQDPLSFSVWVRNDAEFTLQSISGSITPASYAEFRTSQFRVARLRPHESQQIATVEALIVDRPPEGFILDAIGNVNVSASIDLSGIVFEYEVGTPSVTPGFDEAVSGMRRGGQEIVMEANDDYWGGRPEIDRLEIKIFSDQQTAYQALMTGDLHIMVMSSNLWKQLDELVSLHTLSYEWVAGHAGHEENERCDELAVAAYQQYL